MVKIGANAKCPCGSGKKFKRCCRDLLDARVSFTPQEREQTRARLSRFAHEAVDVGEMLDGFCCGEPERLEALDEGFVHMSRDVWEGWLFFDLELSDGGRLVDRFIAEEPGLGMGAVSWLRRMRDSTMRLYEVVDVRPGVSITMLDVRAEQAVTVAERSGSRSITPGSLLGARVNPVGLSGQPEFDFGVVAFAPMSRHHVEAEVQRAHEAHAAAHPAATDTMFWKTMAPALHDAWLVQILEPPMPALRNQEGHELLFTTVHAEVADRASLLEVFTRWTALHPDGNDCWSWLDEDGETVLGRFELGEERLAVQTMSRERADRAKSELARRASGLVRIRATEHHDLQGMAQSEVGERESVDSPENEQLALAFYARHYHAWTDEPVPALGSLTPREAAGRQDMRERVASLVRGLEDIYLRALRDGSPAYDPSWMWGELGFREDEQKHPPPLSHERWYGAWDGLADAVQQAADRVRSRPGFDDRVDRVSEDSLATDLSLVRLRESVPAVARLLPWLVDFELHRRKNLWVDPALCWELSQTELALPRSLFELPFVSFALVFTDRVMLSLCERFIAREYGGLAAAGHMLRVATIYVHRDDDVVHLQIALDALGADPPDLVTLTWALEEEISGCSFEAPPPPRDGILHLVGSAILHATQPGVAQTRSVADLPERAVTRVPREPEVWSSDDVFFLPGSITLARVRELQTLERAPGGRAAVCRHMVRGHWRRPNPNWKDQRPRWIAPHWRGPRIGPIVERAYRLTV